MGAALSSLCKSEQEVFFEAASKGDAETVSEMLHKKGKRVQVNMRDKDGFTALHLAAEAGSVACVKKLIELQAKVDMPTDVGFSALNLACKSGMDNVARVLIDSKASLETADTAYGCTALLWAVQYCSADTVRRLLEAGAKTEVKSRFGSTPLMLAAEAGQLDKVRHLLANGANPKAKDSRGGTALSKAKDKGHRQVADEVQAAINKADGIVPEDDGKGKDEGKGAKGKGDAKASPKGQDSKVTPRAGAGLAGRKK